MPAFLHRSESFLREDDRRSHVLASLVRSGITLSTIAVEFYDHLYFNGTVPSSDEPEYDSIVLNLYNEYVRTV